MPNMIAPKGFAPVRYLNGAAWNGALNTYFIPATDTNVYAPGDAVKSSAQADPNGVPGVTKASGTDVLRGVIVGCLVAFPYGPSLVGATLDLTVQGIPAAKIKGYYVQVVDDPQVLFEIADNGLSVIPLTAMSKNFSFTVANPSGASQNSGSVLLNSSAATSAALPLKLFGAVQRDDNDPTLTNARWLVKINQHELSGGTAGV